MTSILAVAVLVGAYLSARSLGVQFAYLLRWQVLAATALSGALIGLNAVEYRLIGGISGVSVPFGRSAEVSVLAGIANLLPLPGGVLVRLERLNTDGATIGSALRSNVFVAGAWVSLAAFIGAGLLWVHQEPLAAILAATVGGVSIVISVVVLQQPPVTRFHLLGKALFVEALFLILATLRVGLTAHGLGLPLDVVQSVLLAVTSVLATTIGVIPGGWGLWEGLSAALAPLVGLEPEAALLTSAVVRVQNIVGLGVGLGVIGLRRQAKKRGQARSAT